MKRQRPKAIGSNCAFTRKFLPGHHARQVGQDALLNHQHLRQSNFMRQVLRYNVHILTQHVSSDFVNKTYFKNFQRLV